MKQDPAKGRFIVMQLVRLSGVALVMLGLAITVGRTALPAPFGIVLVLIGLFEVLALPIILSRRWKSPPE